jgi:syntaxin-binding protein 5
VSWSIVGEPVPCKAMADPLPDGTFVVDTQGVLIGADRARLAASFRVPTDNTLPCLMITVGAKGARCNFNIDGEKVAKIEWGSKVGLVQSVQIVTNFCQYFCQWLLSFLNINCGFQVPMPWSYRLIATTC